MISQHIYDTFVLYLEPGCCFKEVSTEELGRPSRCTARWYLVFLFVSGPLKKVYYNVSFFKMI